MKCVASFNYYVMPNTRDVKFTNTSTGTLASYLWDFNDGSTATSSNASMFMQRMGCMIFHLLLQIQALPVWTILLHRY